MQRVFIDTNILVFAQVGSAPFHQRANRTLDDLVSRYDEVWISRQVIREFIATTSRPGQFVVDVPMKQITGYVKLLHETFYIADETQEVTDKLVELLGDIRVGGKQIHDANIVATMLVNEITALHTHNVRDFRRFQGLIEVIPLEVV